MRIVSLFLAGSLLISGSAGFAKRDPNYIPEVKLTGKPVSCVPLSQLRESRVRSDQVIDFRVSNKKWYRSTLPHHCPSLGFEQRFSYKTSLSQLCSSDIITVLQDFGGRLQGGASCGLGMFQPVEMVPVKAKP